MPLRPKRALDRFFRGQLVALLCRSGEHDVAAGGHGHIPIRVASERIGAVGQEKHVAAADYERYE